MHIQVLKWTNAVFTAEDTDIVEVQVEAEVPEDIIPVLAPDLVLTLALIPAPAPVRQGYYCFHFPYDYPYISNFWRLIQRADIAG